MSLLTLSLLACSDGAIPLRPDRTGVDDSAGPDDSAADTADSAADTDDSAADTATDTVDTADTAAPGTCGDGTADGGFEECDGDDDGACPDRCNTACQCPSTEATGVLSLFVVDVWQGDGMLLVSPDGFTMLVDAGDVSTYEDFSRFLHVKGYDELDHTLVSHQHADHMGAMDEVLEDHPEVTLAWDSGSRADTVAFDDYEAAAGDRRTTVAVGDTLDLGPSMTVEVLHADVADRDNENNNSVVLRLTYGGVRLLLGGDCEYLVCEQAFDPGPIDIYKVHHHGSEDASGPELVESMQPSVALISTGEGNDYGHPDDPTIAVLEELGAEVWRTDEHGSLRVDVDGNGWNVSAEGP